MRLGRSREVFTDRRRAPRSQAKYLQLAYWNGAHGVLRPIREVSSYGAFIETQDRWCADTVLQAQLIAELPLAAQLREAAVQDVSGSENDARQSAGGGNRLLPTKNAPSTEKLSLALSCRIVRLVPEGICVDFTDRSANGKQRRALEGFLTAVEERTRKVEASADCQQPGAVPSSAPVSPAADGPRDKRRFLPRTVVRLFNNCSFRERFSYLWAKILALSTSQFSSRPS